MAPLMVPCQAKLSQTGVERERSRVYDPRNDGLLLPGGISVGVQRTARAPGSSALSAARARLDLSPHRRTSEAAGCGRPLAARGWRRDRRTADRAPQGGRHTSGRHRDDSHVSDRCGRVAPSSGARWARRTPADGLRGGGQPRCRRRHRDFEPCHLLLLRHAEAGRRRGGTHHASPGDELSERPMVDATRLGPQQPGARTHPATLPRVRAPSGQDPGRRGTDRAQEAREQSGLLLAVRRPAEAHGLRTAFALPSLTDRYGVSTTFRASRRSKSSYPRTASSSFMRCEMIASGWATPLATMARASSQRPMMFAVPQNLRSIALTNVVLSGSSSSWSLCTPITLIRPPARAMSMQSSSAGTNPTRSRTASAPRPSVRSCTKLGTCTSLASTGIAPRLWAISRRCDTVSTA